MVALGRDVPEVDSKHIGVILFLPLFLLSGNSLLLTLTLLCIGGPSFSSSVSSMRMRALGKWGEKPDKGKYKAIKQLRPYDHIDKCWIC